jgi:hypothetical protein
MELILPFDQRPALENALQPVEFQAVTVLIRACLFKRLAATAGPGAAAWMRIG